MFWEVLCGGIIDGVKYLGMGKDFGSIEKGKFVDLVVIDGDVLSDIRKSEFVEYIVLNGCVYELVIMNEVGSKKKCKLFFFE